MSLLPVLDRPARAPEWSVEVRPLRELADIEPAWRALFVEAVEPNPFYGPDFLLPLAHLRGGRPQVALAWRRVGGGQALAGLLPFVAEPGIPLLRPPVLRSFADPYVGNATPLLAGDQPGVALAHLLDGLRQHAPQALLLIDPLRLDGPVARELAASGQAQATIQVVERAALRAGLDADAYLSARVAGKRVRELRRCEKRLTEAGTLEIVTLQGAAAAPAVEAFLAIEASGWKGREGTALASRPQTLAFARAALMGAAPAVVADCMRLDGRPIAVAIHLAAGDEAVAFKCAYDEDWGKASPGALLDLHTLRMVLGDGRLALMDSGAQPGHPVEALWRERITFAGVLVALRPETREADLEAAARRIQAATALLRRAKSAAKRALGRKQLAAQARTG